MVPISLLAVIALALLLPRVAPGPPARPASQRIWWIDLTLTLVTIILWFAAFYRYW